MTCINRNKIGLWELCINTKNYINNCLYDDAEQGKVLHTITIK